MRLHVGDSRTMLYLHRGLNVIKVLLVPVFLCALSPAVLAQTNASDVEYQYQIDPKAAPVIQAVLQAGAQTLAIHLSGTMVSSKEQGTVELYSSPTAWREDIEVSGQRSTETYNKGNRSHRDPKTAQVVTTRAPSMGADFYPIHMMSTITKNKHADVEYVGAETFAGVATDHIRISASSRPVAFQKAHPALPMLTVDKFTQEDVFTDVKTHLIVGIRYNYPGRPVVPQVPRVCKGPSGEMLAHPVQENLKKIDCAAAIKLLPIPVEVHYLDYRQTAAGMIPFVIERTVPGQAPSRIEITSAEPLADLSSDKLQIQ
jgi:hypothetical protein